MSRKKYGVVILNYRCANDSVIAAKTVMENAEDDNYVICIVEGGSGDEKEKEILKNAKLKNTHILFLNNNYGYARGNNEGVRFLNERYELDYIVIMNPDVCIVQKSTIEDVIKEIEKNGDLIGGQPLVKTGNTDVPPNKQVNIRDICYKKDCLMLSCFIFNRIFKKRYREYIYYNEMPYNKPIEYYVPSGAFFVVKRDFFTEIEMFDERTFLYSEELIFGYKVKANDKKMVLVPTHFVEHECGKSIGANDKKPSKFSHAQKKKSFDVYMKYYLKMGGVSRRLILLLKDFDFVLKKAFWKFR